VLDPLRAASFVWSSCSSCREGGGHPPCRFFFAPLLPRTYYTYYSAPLRFDITTHHYASHRITSYLPRDWGQGWANVWLGVSVGRMITAHRIDKLGRFPQRSGSYLPNRYWNRSAK
jgi:hypothetical protein